MRIAILVCVLSQNILVSGCDPGSSYKSLNPDGTVSPQWSETVDGVRLVTDAFNLLVGDSNCSRSLEVTNDSADEVVVLGCDLINRGKTISATKYTDKVSLNARTVPAGKSKIMHFGWDLDGYAGQILGPELTWVWHVKIGDRKYDLREVMKRPLRRGK